jgi:hypothetical protein
MRAGEGDPARAAAWLAAQQSSQGACGRIRLEERRFLFELEILVLEGGRPRRAASR